MPRYLIVKDPEGAFTPQELSHLKIADLPALVKIYVDPKKPYKPVKREKAKHRKDMILGWQWDRLTEGDREAVKELYAGKYIKEIMYIFAERGIYPDTVCDTCFEKLKIQVKNNVRSAISQGII